MPNRALLVSLDGNPGPEAWNELGKLCAKYPDARIGLHFDNDQPKPKLFAHSGLFMDEGAGRKFGKRAEEAIRSHAPEAIIVHRAPPAEYKDWNDYLRGSTRMQAEADHAAVLQRCSGPDATLEDRGRARDQLDKTAFDAEVCRLWDAKEGGFLPPEEIEQACKSLLDGQAAIKAAAEARETLQNDEKTQRGEVENARREMARRHNEARKDGSMSEPQIAGELADFDRSMGDRISDRAAKEEAARQKEEQARRIREALRNGTGSPAPGPRMK
jgi:hypothetical protein